jgi:hypothetical protein
MKLYKLQRDNKALIMQQIDWLNKMAGVDLNADDVMSLANKSKPELIKIWEQCYKCLSNPSADWLEIYL